MKLTTITPYWNRPEMLMGWLKCVKAASVPNVEHIIYFINSSPPDWWCEAVGDVPIRAVYQPEAPGKSIGHYHNLGASSSQAEWIMKLDVDAIPNSRYFQQLLSVLGSSSDREWFNGGMLMLSQRTSGQLGLPLSESEYTRIVSLPRMYASQNGWFPQATNFICRRADYLKLGGCHKDFHSYGWEDYQQIYMLENFYRGRDPLPGEITIQNVTNRCRDEISRPKAKQLSDRDRWLTLLHRWHPVGSYKTKEVMDRNRAVLFGYVEANRKTGG